MSASKATKLERMDQVLQALFMLNDDEVEVLYRVSEGLLHGREAYGPLKIETDTRDFREESVQELRDCLVYVNMAILKLMRS